MQNEFTTGQDGLPHIEKVAGKRLDYTFDLSDYFAGIGADMGAFTVAAPAVLGVVQGECIKQGNAVTVFAGDQGDVAGYSHPVTLHFDITGGPGRDDSRTIVIDVVRAK